MKMERRRTTVYLSEGLVEMAHERGINVSDVLDRALRQVLSIPDELGTLKKRRSELVAELAAVDARIAALEEKHRQQYTAEAERLKALEEHRQYYQKKMQEHRLKGRPWLTRDRWLEQTARQFGMTVAELVSVMEERKAAGKTEGGE